MGLTIIPTGLGVAEARYVNVAGDTMSGNLSLGGNILLDVGKLSMVGDIELGANKLKTTDLAFYQWSTSSFALRDATDTYFRGLVLSEAYLTAELKVTSAQSFMGSTYFSAYNADGGWLVGRARKTGIGLQEIWRMVGAAEPHLLLTHAKIGARTLPTPSADFRGFIYRVEGAAGVPDRLYMCMKNSLDAYEWVQIATAS